MKRTSVGAVLASVVIAGCCLTLSGTASAGAKTGPVERLAARAVDPADAHAAPSPVEIVIEQWSTDAQADALTKAIAAGGSDTLLSALQGMKRRVGFILTPGMQARGTRARGRRAQNVFFAREVTTAQGREVVVATEHPPTFFAPDPKAPESPAREFTVIEIRFGADGKGVGKVASAGHVQYNEKTKTVEIGDYKGERVRLTDVTSDRH
jgi:hypothetical protein